MIWVVTAVALGSLGEVSPRAAEAEFDAGVRLRDDAEAARPHFAAAAEAFDRSWRAGDRTPAVARNRGRAHFLAGDLPAAILALRDGLALAPWDAGLRRDLEVCRDAVGYPTPATPADAVRPEPPSGLQSRISPAMLFAATVLASIVLAVGLSAYFTVRPGWSLPAAAVGTAGLFAVGVAAREISRELLCGRERIAVASRSAVMRTGNADAYPARLTDPIPRGAEVAVLGRRGGWLHVELAGGAVGWLPEAAAVRPAPVSAADR